MKKRRKNKNVIDLPILLKESNIDNPFKNTKFKTTKPTANMVLRIIKAYDDISRDALAYNLRKAMGTPFVSYHVQDNWLAEVCKTNKNTIYSWLAVHRNAKAPLKTVALIAKRLNIPFLALLQPPDKSEAITLRKGDNRYYSCENVVVAYSKYFSDKSYKEIADDLGVAEGTVRRHLINYRKNHGDVI